MTFTRYELSHYDIYVNDDNGKVHHAVDQNASEFKRTTLYPYEPCKNGGWDNVCDMYTLRQVKNRLDNGKISFK